MNTENPNIITYTNWLEFEGRKLAFRNKELFDITETPKWIPYNDWNRFWIVNRKQLTKKRAKELIIKETIVVDISALQWYQQERLRHCFQLEQLK